MRIQIDVDTYLYNQFDDVKKLQTLDNNETIKMCEVYKYLGKMLINELQMMQK